MPSAAPKSLLLDLFNGSKHAPRHQLIGPFDVIVADPPWRYDNPRADLNWKTNWRHRVNVQFRYDTMTVDELNALPVASIAATNSLLFLWTTNLFLADGSASDVARAWGFVPKTVLTWAKVKRHVSTIEPSMKNGHWFRSATEHIVVGVRGSVKRPDGWPAFPTWLPGGAPEGALGFYRAGHSVKPDEFYEWAERAVPGGTYLEMFSRRAPRNERWAIWGDEVSSTFRFPGRAPDEVRP